MQYLSNVAQASKHLMLPRPSPERPNLRHAAAASRIIIMKLFSKAVQANNIIASRTSQ
jgi:hypothetical protein